MKRIVIAVLFIFLLMCGCTHQLPLKQSTDNISKIELINENQEGVLCILTGEDVSQFMDDLLELECNKNLQPQADFGYLQIRIYYENGDADIVGCRSNGYIKDGELVIHGWYDYKEEDLLELFNSYVDQTP